MTQSIEAMLIKVNELKIHAYKFRFMAEQEGDINQAEFQLGRASAFSELEEILIKCLI